MLRRDVNVPTLSRLVLYGANTVRAMARFRG